MNDSRRVAHVHGRFQPFHDEHLEYVRWATTDCSADRVIVGITNADPSHTAQTDANPSRHRPQNNPFTYYERHLMVQETLKHANLPCQISVIPFPINRPELWDAYVPSEVVHYINVLEEWHEYKAERLQDHGQTVRTKRGTRTISGTGIRRSMATGDMWDDRVPDPVAAVIRERGLVDRVQDLHSEDGD